MVPYKFKMFEKKLRGALGGLLSSPKDFVFKGDEIFPRSFFLILKISLWCERRAYAMIEV